MRKLSALLLIPIVAILTMGAALMPSEAMAAPAPAVAVHSDVVLSAAVADAVATTATVEAPTRIICAARGCDIGEFDPAARDEAYAKSWYLPLNRWSDMSLHSRLNWWNPVLASNASTARGAESLLVNAGNGMWGTASDWVRSSTNFDPLDGALGYQVDKITGVVGTALKENPVFFAVLFAALLGFALWRALRTPGTRPFGKLIQGAIVFGLIITMGTQAANSTAGSEPDTYEAAIGTPVWIASAVTGTVDVMAGVVVEPVMLGLRSITDAAAGGESSPGWTCSRQTDAAFEVASQMNPATPGSRAVVTAMNSMWLRTSYATYANLQFGDSNPYGYEVACRQLERTTHADAWTRGRMLSMALYGDLSTVSNSASGLNNAGLVSFQQPLMQSVAGDNEMNDRVLVGLAACQPTATNASSFKVRPGWSQRADGSEWVSPSACAALWRAADGTAVSAISNDVFNIGSVDDARAITSDARVLNFIGTLHGADVGTIYGGITLAVIYAIGALIAAVIFGALGIVVLASKIFMVLLVVGMFLVMAMTLFRKESMGSQMKSPMQRFVGVTIFSFGATLLLGVIATFSMIFAELASMFGADGSAANLLWVSLSPLGAVIALHFIFTKLLKMPSPVTPAGALAWGTAGGAIGSAVGTGIANRGQRAFERGLTNAGRHALGSTKATSWMVGTNYQHDSSARKGSGSARREGNEDVLGRGYAGQREHEILAPGNDTPAPNSSEAQGRRGKGKGANQAVDGANALLANMSREDAAALKAEARSEYRKDNPTKLGVAVGNLRDRSAQKQQAALDALHEDMAAGGERADNAVLSTDAQQRGVSFVNKPGWDMDSFLSAPGAEPAAEHAATPAKWGDLTTAGKREAMMLATKKRRESQRQEREERKAARAELPPLRERASAGLVNTRAKAAEAVKGAAGATATAAKSASEATVAGTRRAARDAVSGATFAAKNPVVAAKLTPYVAKAGADKARAVAANTAAAMRSKPARAALVGAGVTVAALGNPLVGAVVVGKVASRGLDQAKQQRRERADVQARYVLAAAQRRMPAPRTGAPSVAPGTSTVNPAPPVSAKPTTKAKDK